MKKVKMFITISVAIIMIATVLSGCDLKAPVISGIDSVIELDCNTEFNLKDYLIDNVKIADETDEGIVDYRLTDLTYEISCDDSVYDEETGKFNTDKYGNYDVELSVTDMSHNKTKFAFTVKLNPLNMDSKVEELVKINCGTSFNIKDYLNERITITNADKSIEYKLNDFDYTIDCSETVYNAASGTLDTSKSGEYDVALTINAGCFENNKINFKINFNPLVIDKGYYVYKSDISSSGYDYLGYCEYKNTSVENLSVTSVEFQFFDKDGVMIASSDSAEYSRDYLAGGESGYSLDTYASFNSTISSEDEIANVEVNIKYEKNIEADSTSLEVEDMKITNDYDYNVSGFAGTTVVTNPYNKDVE
ncbi:MAG TPA: hypothetical protein IAA41_02555, partial [Candidatus Eubacterium faecavium]|nr:hypothetical protein [Candidatus Eubacterium faecavium]